MHKTTRERLRSALGPFAPLLLAFACGALFLSAMRLGFAVAWHDRIVGTPGAWYSLALGLRMDTVLLCYLLSVPVLLTALLPARGWRDALVAGWLAACAFVLVYMELATPAFVAEYDKRPDRVFLEYLAYPRELVSMLWVNHKFGMIGLPLLAGLAAWLAWRAARSALAAAPAWGAARRLAMLGVLVLPLALGARSSLEPRPANISTASFSTNRLVNELTLNSTYTVAYAANSMRNEVDAAALYGSMAWPEIQARVERYRRLPGDGDVHARSVAWTALRPALRRPNLVILLEESLGAGYVGHLGGLPLTPHLDGLCDEGLCFTEMYATGTRTARGIEAVVAGFPPSPSLSVLKLPGAQGGFFTLGAQLQAHGYTTEFIYGGAANFDDMRAFHLANGFDRVIEGRDFVTPTFASKWGVSDEDLMTRANDEFRRHGDRPFFAVLLSTSNHEPFDIPADRIEPYNAPLYTRENAIKYADHAIGRFFDLARREQYYANTVFVVVADHDARVFGAPLVPVEHFRVPAVVIGPGVPAGRYHRVASQVDLAPTLLGLLGIDGTLPGPGSDLMRPPADHPGRALMQYDLSYGFRLGDRLVVLQPTLPPQTFRIDGRHLVPVSDDPELTRDALAHVLWPGEVYRRKLYHVQAPGPGAT